MPVQALRKAEGGLSLGSLMEPVLSLGLSSALGCGYGVLIGRLLAVPSRPFNVVLKRLPPATASRRACTPATWVLIFRALCEFGCAQCVPGVMLHRLPSCWVGYAAQASIYFLGMRLEHALEPAPSASQVQQSQTCRLRGRYLHVHCDLQSKSCWAHVLSSANGSHQSVCAG